MLTKAHEYDACRKRSDGEIRHEGDSDTGVDEFELHGVVECLGDDPRVESREAACAIDHLETRQRPNW